MALSPLGDVVIPVAVGQRPARRKQQHLGQRMRHPPDVARVLDRLEMPQKRRKPRFLPKQSSGKIRRANPQSVREIESQIPQSINPR